MYLFVNSKIHDSDASLSVYHSKSPSRCTLRGLELGLREGFTQQNDYCRLQPCTRSKGQPQVREHRPSSFKTPAQTDAASSKRSLAITKKIAFSVKMLFDYVKVKHPKLFAQSSTVYHYDPGRINREFESPRAKSKQRLHRLRMGDDSGWWLFEPVYRGCWKSSHVDQQREIVDKERRSISRC